MQLNQRETFLNHKEKELIQQKKDVADTLKAVSNGLGPTPALYKLGVFKFKKPLPSDNTTNIELRPRRHSG